MDKLDMQTPNIADRKFEELAKLFPNAITETITGYGDNGEPIIERAIDADVLRQEIACKVIEGNEERYQFTWPDKKKSVLMSNAPITKTLRPYIGESVNFDDTQNIYIQGDNLDVLKLLQETYLHKIDVIYIDPPYNTGSNLIYKNDFHMTVAEYMANSGQYDEEGNLLVKNLTSNGRYHTDWLNMIYQRVRLAKDLLTDTGILVLTIDDYEIYTVTMLLNEVFGEDNHLGTVIIKNNPQGRSSVTGFQISHEYALFYRRSTEAAIGRLPRSEEQLARYKERDKNGPFEWRNFRAQYSTESPKMVYPIFVKKDCSDFRIPKLNWNETKREYDLLEQPLEDEIITLPIDETGRTRTWKWSIETVYASKDEEMGVRKDRGGNPTVYFKGRMKDEGMLPYTIWDKPEYSSSTFGANILSEMLGTGVFNYPKSIYAVIDALKVANAHKEALVLDFFSGSATTAQAVLHLNAEDGGNRHFIMVQLPEETEEGSAAFKAGHKTICDVGRERIRRAGTMIKEEKPDLDNLDIGFRSLHLDTSNMKDVFYNPAETEQTLFDLYADNIKDNRTPEDLLFQVMLDLGVLLSSKIVETEIAGKKVFNVADGFLIACFDKDVTEETVKAVAQKHPFYAVFRDSSMANDSVATNFEQIFATYSPETVRKVL